MTEIPEILCSRFSLLQSLLIVDMLHLGTQVGTVRLLCSQHKYEEEKKPSDIPHQFLSFLHTTQQATNAGVCVQGCMYCMSAAVWV